MGVVKEKFGTLQTGEEVYLYTLKNKNGMEAKFTNFGAALVDLFVPDKDGKLEDVVLGFGGLYFQSQLFQRYHRTECEPRRGRGVYVKRKGISSACQRRPQ